MDYHDDLYHPFPSLGLELASPPEGIAPPELSHLNDGLMRRPPVHSIADELQTDGAGNFGEHATLQRFYEGPKTCKCCPNWVERKPEAVPADAQEKYDGVAIRVYMGKDHQKDTLGGLKTTTAQFIVIQSPIIRKHIGPILAEAGMLGEGKAKITIYNPFKVLFFTSGTLRKLYLSFPQMSQESFHFKILLDLFDEFFRESVPKIFDLHEKQMIDCAYLWTIFPKGIVIYSKTEGEDALYELLEIRLSPDPTILLLECRVVNFDGTNFGWEERTLRQPVFHGTHRITELTAYPLAFHHDSSAIERRLIARGKAFLAYQGMAHREYSGDARLCANEDDEDEDDQRRRKSANVTGRVLVDPFTYYKYNPYWTPRVDPLEPSAKESEQAGNSEQSESRTRLRPSKEKQDVNSAQVASKKLWLLLLNPNVPGFSFRENKWFMLNIDHLDEITWNDRAYDHLIIANERKELLLTFVQQHEDAMGVSQDVVEGKGQGLVVLLSGPPGTGKTLTVEAVADRARRPLHRVQAEMLGGTPMTISRNLRRLFELCVEWNAVLLLDEADAFLGKREGTMSTREDTVCVMLRLIEYYSGILFLTTNMPEFIDPAFASRMDIHLMHSTLSQEARRAIWNNMLKSTLVSVKVSEEELTDLASWDLNGREIKKVVKTGMKWCFFKGKVLTAQGLRTAISVSAPTAEKSTVEDQEDRSSKRQRIDD
ncbi:P-loop containing nucleoside triphosphate hydrolase protein [Alternaria rosae]|uniref:P-loop containing nucleoside triphosphate hydrolase protein n=1 Tax=Alternaria rosae TaxID=1187941 RepID=UPI001E8E5C0E|nr:P-loop containing nucleoside triphosphate hydrolase protein [Alternaria rosae]KAH6883168.1 P-loop containing nucleoside triphosphate hydrolase protein [Alternaria rosae]